MCEKGARGRGRERIRRGRFGRNEVWLPVHRRSDKDGCDSMENSPCWRERDREGRAQQRAFRIQYIREGHLLSLL